MTPFRIFRKKEKETVAASVQKTVLEGLCGGDTELYQVLSRTILLNPEMTLKEGIDSYVEKAHTYEKMQDSMRARIAYQIAGEISQYEEKLTQAQKFFKKAAGADPSYVHAKVFEYYSKKENAERAITVAQEFYNRTKKKVQATQTT